MPADVETPYLFTCVIFGIMPGIGGMFFGMFLTSGMFAMLGMPPMDIIGMTAAGLNGTRRDRRQ